MAVRKWVVAGFIVFLSACSSTPDAEDIQIQANWCQDRLDTKAGKCTKDLIVDGDTTISLQLTYAERAHILDAARSIDFFSLPHRISLVPIIEVWDGDTVDTYQVSSGTCICSIRIESRDQTNWVEWDGDAGTPETRERLRWLLEEIWRIIKSKPEYKALPRPTGFYQ
jgi:hypothetical protein